MKKHILLIDEDNSKLKNLTNALSSIARAYKCTYASSAKQALEMLRYLVPDFIFADYYLSGADGLELLSRIKKDPRLRDAKVFLYSNHVNDEFVKPARAMGAAGCIGQPDAIDRLATIFKASLAIGPVAPMLF